MNGVGENEQCDDSENQHYTELTNVKLSHIVSDIENSPWQNGQYQVPPICDFNDSVTDSVQSLPSVYGTPDNRSRSTHVGNNEHSAVIQSYVMELNKIKEQPRSMVIDQIRTLTRDNVTDLDIMRTELFRIANTRDDFPLKEGYLRKRLAARKNGKVVPGSLCQKLSKDCFVLLQACDGEYAEDLSDVVPTRKRADSVVQASQKQSSDDVAGLQVVQESIVIIQRELHEMKTNNSKSISELKQTIDKLVKEKEQAQNRAKKYFTELKNLKTQMTRNEKETEKAMEKIKSIESGNIDVLDELKRLKDDMDALEVRINNDSENMLEIDNTTKKFGVSADKRLASTNKEIKDMRGKISDCLNIAQRFDNSQSNGIASLKNTVKITTQKIKQCEIDTAKMSDAIEENKSNFQTLQRQQNELKKAVKDRKEISNSRTGSTVQSCVTNTVAIQTSNRFTVLDTGHDTETHTCTTRQRVSDVNTTQRRDDSGYGTTSKQTPGLNTNVTSPSRVYTKNGPTSSNIRQNGLKRAANAHMTQGQNVTVYGPTLEPTDGSNTRIASPYTDSPQKGPTSSRTRQNGVQDTPVGNKDINNTEGDRSQPGSTIPVHCPSSVCAGFSSDSNAVSKSDGKKSSERFVGYTKVQRNRIKRLFIHGINKKLCSENAMREFLQQNNIEFTFLRYFEKNWKRTASAQLNLVDNDENNVIIDDPSFWPEGIYVRPWLPREAFLNEHGRG